MDEKATDDVRSRLVDGGECQKLPRHSKGASQDPYNIERNGRRREGQLEGRKRKGRKEKDRLSPIGRVASVRRRVEHTLRDGDGARDGRTECWQRTAFYDLERPPFKSSVSAIIGSAEQRIFC